MVSTQDFESCNPSSILGETFFLIGNTRFVVLAEMPGETFYTLHHNPSWTTVLVLVGATSYFSIFRALNPLQYGRKYSPRKY